MRVTGKCYKSRFHNWRKFIYRVCCGALGWCLPDVARVQDGQDIQSGIFQMTSGKLMLTIRYCDIYEE